MRSHSSESGAALILLLNLAVDLLYGWLDPRIRHE